MIEREEKCKRFVQELAHFCGDCIRGKSKFLMMHGKAALYKCVYELKIENLYMFMSLCSNEFNF